MKKTKENDVEKPEQIRPKPKHYEFKQLEEIINGWVRDTMAKKQQEQK